MRKKLSELVNLYFQQDEWRKARALLLLELRKAPAHHWLLTRLASAFYEERDYKKALIYSKKAMNTDPNCPLVNWDYAGILDMLGDKNEAISVWKILINRGVKDIAYGECGEGIRWAKSLLNDCHYRIGLCYFDLGKKREAIKFIEKHLSLRQRGIPSTYSLKEVRRMLLKVNY